MVRDDKHLKEIVKGLIDQSLDLYKVQPWHAEGRSNLKAYGINAPIKLIHVDDILVIHIKADLSVQDMEQLNTKLRMIFGPFTLVFAFNADIDFLTVKRMSPEEMIDWTKRGSKLIEGEKNAESCRDYTK